MYNVYLLQSEKDNGYYIGQCQDLDRRIQEHNAGKVKSTKGRRPFKCIGYEQYDNRNKARYREYTLKKNSHQRKIFIKKFAGVVQW